LKEQDDSNLKFGKRGSPSDFLLLKQRRLLVRSLDRRWEHCRGQRRGKRGEPESNRMESASFNKVAFDMKSAFPKWVGPVGRREPSGDHHAVLFELKALKKLRNPREQVTGAISSAPQTGRIRNASRTSS
jgi:hypothetical protein